MGNLQSNGHCEKGCPAHCDDETPEEITAKGEIALRNKALGLSSVVLVILTLSHIYFAYLGKILPIPEIIWAIALAPWVGTGGSKVAEVLTKTISKR